MTILAIDFPEYKFTLVYLQLEDDSDYELELTYNYDHEAYDLGDGYGHIAVGVDDLEATHQAHKEAGYTVTDLSGLPGKPKMYYFITDPDGYKLHGRSCRLIPTRNQDHLRVASRQG